MHCRVCGVSLYDRRSDLCLACSAVETQSLEFREAWTDKRLRGIATEIALGAARSIRALRIFGRNATDHKAEVVERPPLERSNQRKQEREEAPRKAESREPHSEPKAGHRSFTPKERVSRGGPAENPRGETRRRTLSPSVYSSSPEPERRDRRRRLAKEDPPRESRGATPKKKPESDRKSQEHPWHRTKRPAEEKTLDRGREGEKEDKYVEAKYPAGSEKDKEDSKAAYLESQKHLITLREGPKKEAPRPLPQNLLELPEERAEHDRGREEKRRR